MAEYNKGTLQQRIDDFTDRNSPFDGNPLIQKTELQTILDDVTDSTVFRQGTSASLNNPASSFDIDFEGTDLYIINTTTAIPTNFSMNLLNLSDNSVGRIEITKKTSQNFSFGNGTVYPFENISEQASKTTLRYRVYNTNGEYSIHKDFESLIQSSNMANSSVTIDAMAAESVGASQVFNNQIAITDHLNVANLHTFEGTGLFSTTGSSAVTNQPEPGTATQYFIIACKSSASISHQLAISFNTGRIYRRDGAGDAWILISTP